MEPNPLEEHIDTMEWYIRECGDKKRLDILRRLQDCIISTIVQTLSKDLIASIDKEKVDNE